MGAAFRLLNINFPQNTIAVGDAIYIWLKHIQRATHIFASGASGFMRYLYKLGVFFTTTVMLVFLDIQA